MTALLDKIKSFFTDLWTKIKAACLGSITMAWSYVVTTAGALFANIESIAAVMGDPNLTAQLQAVVGDAKMLGKWLLTVGIVTAIARLKSLVLAKPAPTAADAAPKA
jgi:hypothetical protein